MGCNCESKSIVLANDSRIESEFNGNAAGYWDQSGSWTKPCGMTSLLLYLHILDIEKPSGDTATVTVLAQGSIDGKTWTDLNTVQVRSFTDVGGDAMRLVFPTRLSAMPLVRFGLQIASNGTTQVAARLSAVVTPVDGDHELVSLQVEESATAATGAIEATEIEVTGVSTINGRVREDSFGASETWTAAIEGSYDNEEWFDTGESVSLMKGSIDAESFSLSGEQLPRFLRLYKTAGSATAGTVIIDILGRSF